MNKHVIILLSAFFLLACAEKDSAPQCSTKPISYASFQAYQSEQKNKTFKHTDPQANPKHKDRINYLFEDTQTTETLVHDTNRDMRSAFDNQQILQTDIVGKAASYNKK